MAESNETHPRLVDLSYWIDPEPLDFKYGEKTYHASFGLPTVLHTRISVWVSGLLGMSEEDAERASVALTAEVLKIPEGEAADIHPLARKTLLGFLVSGRLSIQATGQ